MKKHALPALALALAALLGGGTFVTASAVGDAPAPTAGQTIADYMNDDNDAQWDKLQTWIEAEYGEGATVPTTPPTTEPTTPPTTEPTTPAPSPSPTQETGPKISSGEVVLTDTGATFDGKIANVPPGTRIQLRTDTQPLDKQRGFYEYELTTSADGAVKIVLDDYTTPPETLHWKLSVGGTEFEYGDVFATGELKRTATPSPSPTPSTPTTEPTTPPATTDHSTNGTGGALTNRTFQSFTNADGTVSQYHIYAAGLDWSKDVGILVYGDGSAEYGLKNPTDPYLLAGTNGLVAKAKANNMLLVTPLAPGTGCHDGDGTCWYQTSSGYDPNEKAKWSADLVKDVYKKYDVHKDRFAFGGYSSGAQWTTQFFGPTWADELSVDGVGVAISYGGSPLGVEDVSSVPVNYSAAHKSAVPMVWDVGTRDPAYGTDPWEARGGKQWYDSNGFSVTQLHTGDFAHSRSDFGIVMDREIKEHVRPS